MAFCPYGDLVAGWLGALLVWQILQYLIDPRSQMEYSGKDQLGSNKEKKSENFMSEYRRKLKKYKKEENTSWAEEVKCSQHTEPNRDETRVSRGKNAQ